MTTVSIPGEKKWVRIALGILLGLLALNAYAGGYYALSGAPGVPPEWLKGSPFQSYFIPGLFLFIVIGGMASGAAITIFIRGRFGRMLAIATGILTLLWLAVQLAIIGYVSWMQPATAIGAAGILLLAGKLPAHAG